MSGAEKMSDNFIPGFLCGIIVSFGFVALFGDETSYPENHNYAVDICSKNDGYKRVDTYWLSNEIKVSCSDGANFIVDIRSMKK